MYLARIICSDSACAERAVVEAETLEELDALLCDCGCSVQVLGIPDLVDDERIATVTALPRRTPPRDLAA